MIVYNSVNLRIVYLFIHLLLFIYSLLLSDFCLQKKRYEQVNDIL